MNIEEKGVYSFFETLLWSLVSVIEKNNERKINLIDTIVETISIQCERLPYNDSNIKQQNFSSQFDEIFVMYLNSYESYKSSDKFNTNLQQGRYSKSFTEVRKISKGGYGKVFEVKSKIDNAKYALKKVKLSSKLGLLIF
jgi:hypothetical protein